MDRASGPGPLVREISATEGVVDSAVDSARFLELGPSCPRTLISRNRSESPGPPRSSGERSTQRRLRWTRRAPLRVPASLPTRKYATHRASRVRRRRPPTCTNSPGQHGSARANPNRNPEHRVRSRHDEAGARRDPGAALPRLPAPGATTLPGYVTIATTTTTRRSTSSPDATGWRGWLLPPGQRAVDPRRVALRVPVPRSEEAFSSSTGPQRSGGPASPSASRSAAWSPKALDGIVIGGLLDPARPDPRDLRVRAGRAAHGPA